MFERFSDRARKIMALANQECQKMHHACLEPIHILLGLVKERQSVAVRALQSINYTFDIRRVREAVEKANPSTTDSPPQGKYPQSDQTKQLVQDAIAIARRLNHNYVGSEHLLIALAGNVDPSITKVREAIHLPSKDVIESAVLDLLGNDDSSQVPIIDTPQATEQSFDVSELRKQLFGDQVMVSTQQLSILIPAEIATLLVLCSEGAELSVDLFRSRMAKTLPSEGPH